MALWSLDELANAVQGRVDGSPASSVSGISIDTRTLAAGDAFFAIQGERFDGHGFVGQALEQGAALAVVSQPADGPVVVVDDVLRALERLGRAARRRCQGTVIGVTGSVGKTSSKEMLKLVLSRQGLTHASAKSYNNHWGVPLTLAQLPREARFGVFEMGMNHAGEISVLSQMVQPQIAIITAIEPVHLEHLGTIEAVADAKAEIVDGMSGGVLLLPRDSLYYQRMHDRAMAAGVRVLSFGVHETADYRLLDVSFQPGSCCVHALLEGEEATYKVGSTGRHSALNSLAVLGAAHLAGADMMLAALALADARPPGGRGEQKTLVLPEGEVVLIDESYNANPASVRVALDVLGNAPVGYRGRRIAVLGDMLELGTDSARMHAGLVEPVISYHVDLVFCAGPLMASLWDALPAEWRGGYAYTAQELEEAVAKALCPGDVIMVKGSHGSRMWSLVAALEKRFPETLEKAL